MLALGARPSSRKALEGVAPLAVCGIRLELHAARARAHEVGGVLSGELARVVDEMAGRDPLEIVEEDEGGELDDGHLGIYGGCGVSDLGCRVIYALLGFERGRRWAPA